MQLKSIVLLASFVAGAMAHATVYGAWINGVFQGDGRNAYVRPGVLGFFLSSELI